MIVRMKFNLTAIGLSIRAPYSIANFKKNINIIAGIISPVCQVHSAISTPLNELEMCCF